MFGKLGICERLVALLASSNILLQNTVLCTVCNLAPVEARFFGERGTCEETTKLLDSRDLEIRMNAAVTMEKLALGCSENAKKLCTPMIFQKLKHLASTSRHQRLVANAMAALVALESTDTSVEWQALAVESGLVSTTVALLGHVCLDVKYQSAVCLCSLTYNNPVNSRKALELGVVGLAMNLIQGSDTDIIEITASVVENLISAEASAVPVFVEAGIIGVVGGLLSHSNLSVAEAVMACIAPMATTLEVRKEIRKMKIHRKLWAFVIGEVASTDALVVRGCAVLQVLSQDQEVATELRDMDACFILSQLLNECPKPEYKYILKSLLTNLSQADTAHVTPVHP
eukprot:c9406_g1_i1.p1 GENE.c9406_g1_i1~~c9406_g1_i1.p1  ORF type:complete len:392 (+),score=106.91 c9406_g1_i1:148-1176(+)